MAELKYNDENFDDDFDDFDDYDDRFHQQMKLCLSTDDRKTFFLWIEPLILCC